MMKSSVEELLQKINADGWWIAAFYQMRDDHWEVALRKKGDFTSAYGKGATPRNALIVAWKDAKGREHMTDKKWAEVDWTKMQGEQRKAKSIPRFRRKTFTCPRCGAPGANAEGCAVCGDGPSG